MTNKTKPIPNDYHSVTPYLVVPGIAKLIDFLKQAFGARELERFSRPDGTVQHAELKIRSLCPRRSMYTLPTRTLPTSGPFKLTAGL
jgi:hypothetical protein